MTAEHVTISIRDAALEDAPAIDAVLRALGWFTHLDDLPSSETQARIARVIAEKCPPNGDNTLLVAETTQGTAVGYLFVHWLPNLIFGGEGYVSELFILPEARGRGVGQAAMARLIDASREAGLWKLLSRVFPENRASLTLMAWSGFNEIGVHRNHGKLDGVWRDCVIVERLIEENID